MASEVAALRPATLVDTCVLLDVAMNDPHWAQWSAQQITEALDSGRRLVINPLVYAEVSVGYDQVEVLEAALPAVIYEREALPYSAAFAAGKAFLNYRRAGGTRTSPLPDFYIGAHAAVARYTLLTRDSKRFTTYFPTVELITP